MCISGIVDMAGKSIQIGAESPDVDVMDPLEHR